MMKIRESAHATRSDIRVIGIGGAGCSSLHRLVERTSNAPKMLGIDTGSATQALFGSVATLTIGEGLGSGGNIETALNKFLESESHVEQFVDEADVVIILAGLGRGTGSGLSPRVADIARRSGALTIALVNMPFEFEGRFRNQLALDAHEQLEQSADVVITMNNNDLLSVSAVGTSLSNAFQESDEKLVSTVRAISAVLGSFSHREDAVRRSLEQAGESAVIKGTAYDLHAGRTAVANAFASTKDCLASLNTAIIHVEGGIGLSPGQVEEAVMQVRTLIGLEAQVHVSTERLIGSGSKIKVTLVLAGITYEQDIPNKTIPTMQTPIRNVPQVASIFDTPLPKRTRGPILLPTG